MVRCRGGGVKGRAPARGQARRDAEGRRGDKAKRDGMDWMGILDRADKAPHATSEVLRAGFSPPTQESSGTGFQPVLEQGALSNVA